MANFRFDSRSREQFEKDIKDYTDRERFLLQLFLDELESLGMSAQASDHGCDNSGAFLSSASRLADYLIRLGQDTYLLEIKFGPSPKYVTFKVDDLKAYISQSAYILLFYSSKNFVGRHIKDVEKEKKNLLYEIVRPETMRQILLDCKPFRFRGMGNKECVQILKNDFGKYFNFKPLNHLWKT